MSVVLAPHLGSSGRFLFLNSASERRLLFEKKRNSTIGSKAIMDKLAKRPRITEKVTLLLDGSLDMTIAPNVAHARTTNTMRTPAQRQYIDACGTARQDAIKLNVSASTKAL